MDVREEIDQYDLVEVIRVPEQYRGVIDIGDVGVVVEKYTEDSFQIECIQPGGASKWLENLHRQSIRLRSKDPYHRWVKSRLPATPLMKPSVLLGAGVGSVCGGLIGLSLGALARSLGAVLIGLLIGLILGAATGALTAALTVKTAGTQGVIGVGYFVGMLFGGVFGTVLGMLTPSAWRESAQTEGVPVLDALVMGRFETAALLGFLLSIVATIVGIWIGGKNFIPRNLKERYRP